MLAYYVSFLIMSAHAVADVIRNTSQTGLLVIPGVLLLLLGTILRRHLAAGEARSPSQTPAISERASTVKGYRQTLKEFTPVYSPTYLGGDTVPIRMVPREVLNTMIIDSLTVLPQGGPGTTAVELDQRDSGHSLIQVPQIH